MTGQRTYGGVSADVRRAQRGAALLAAALEIIGTQGLEKLTVAGLCAEAGLNERYYYEQFDSRDAVLTALFDEIAAELAAAVTRDVSKTRGDTRATARAAIAAGIGVLTDDPRKARVALIISAATPQLRARAAATNTAFAALVAAQGVDFFGLGAAEVNPAISFRATYLVGGLVQALTGWLHGDLQMTRDELIEHITDVFVLLGEDLARPRD